MDLDATRPAAVTRPLSRLARWLLVAAGSLSVALAVIGIVVPLLPTTPFLLLAAACFARSSVRLHRWLFTNRLFGARLSDYVQGRGLPLRSKLGTLTLLWVGIGASAWLAVPARLWWVRALLVLIAVAVTVHVALVPTRRA